MILANEIAMIYTQAAADGMTVNVVVGALTVPGFLDQADNELFSGVGQARDYTVRLQTANFPTLKRGDALTVDGQAYTVRDVRLIGDGLEKAVHLYKA